MSLAAAVRAVAVTALALGGAASVPVSGAGLLDDVRQAFAAFEKAPRTRTTIQFRIGTRDQRYLFERSAPDRLRMISSEGDVKRQVLVIGRDSYYETPAGWTRVTTLIKPETSPSITALYESGLTDLTEATTPPPGYRAITGTISWLSGSIQSRGRVEIRIEAATNVPGSVSFAGECGALPCSFVQTFEYPATLVIDRPAP